jgi:hypothetical protein
MNVTTLKPREQITDALRYTRKARHHPQCRCGAYQKLWCCAEEKIWCTAVDKLITDITR